MMALNLIAGWQIAKWVYALGLAGFDRLQDRNQGPCE